MSFENLLIDRDAGVAILTISRPQRLNALDARTIEELRRAALDFREDDTVRALIVTGAGEKAFVAGADIRELAADTPDSAHRRAREGQQVFDLLENLGKPVIAAVNGLALGGGCELAMACTLRLAADHAKFGQPEINLGLIPGYGGSQRLVRLVGRTKAMEMILTGAPISAQEALSVGLVNRVIPAAELMSAARALAADLAAKAPIALRYAMDAVGHGLDMPFPEGCQLEAALFAVVCATDDMREGTRAFLEKRKPVFKGR